MIATKTKTINESFNCILEKIQEWGSVASNSNEFDFYEFTGWLRKQGVKYYVDSGCNIKLSRKR